MSHVQKRANGRWRARYTDAAGAERSKTFDLRRDAENWLALVTVTPEKYSRGSKRTVGEWATDWFALLEVRETTASSYRSTWKIHVEPALGKWEVGKIDRLVLRRWVADMRSEGKSASVIRKSVATLSGILGLAVESRAIAANPALKLKLRTEQSAERLFLDASQVDELADIIGERYRALVYLAAYGGLRAGEIAALRTSSVHWPRSCVVVSESATEPHGKWTAGPTKSGRSRVVTLPSFVMSELEQHLDGRTSGRVFTSPEGGPHRHSGFYNRTFKPAVLAAPSIPDALRFHDLRHTAVALAISVGAHPKAIMERLGHSTIRLTLDQYGHLFPSTDTDIASGLEKFSRHGDVRSRRAGLRLA